MAEQETINLGIVGISNKGAYNSETQYEKLNVVTYQGSSYCALRDTKGNLPTDTDYWQLYAQKGSVGDTGPEGPKPIKGVDYYTEEDKAEISSEIASNVHDEVVDQVGSLVSATPLAASSISGMTDTSRIYVLTTDGHWYWHNGSQWQDGGIYQAVATDDILNVNTSLFNNNLGSKGVMLYGTSLVASNNVIHPNSYRVNYSAGHYAFVKHVGKNKYCYVKKSNVTSRFRVGLTKYAPPQEEIERNEEIANMLIDDNNATTCAFFSGEYEYVVIYVGTGSSAANVSCKIYEETTPNNDPLFLITDKNNSFLENIAKDLKSNVNVSDLWELGTIGGGSGENQDDPQFIRTKSFIDDDIYEIVRSLEDTNVQVGIRLYNLDGTYHGSHLHYANTFDMPSNTKYFKVRIVIRKIDGATQNDIPTLCSYIKLYKNGNVLPTTKGIDTDWEKWQSVRYYYGFDIAKTPIYNEVEGVFETDTMFSVKGGKGRWSKNANWTGGHVFEGWSKDDKSRLTMLIGKQSQMMGDIFVYSPAGLYEASRRFGWIKVGSDDAAKGADFGKDWTKFYGFITLKNVSTAPTSVPDADLNPQLSEFTNSVPKGTMYYDTSVNKIRVMTNNGWKYLKFED